MREQLSHGGEDIITYQQNLCSALYPRHSTYKEKMKQVATNDSSSWDFTLLPAVLYPSFNLPVLDPATLFNVSLHFTAPTTMPIMDHIPIAKSC